MIEKSFINNQLGINFNSFIDDKFNVWFKAKQVATILGYRDTDQAIRKHIDDEYRKYFPVETTGYSKIGRPLIFINESGLYSLVLSSKLKSAKKFKRWITSEVLPSIRKYNYFKMFDSKIKQRVIIDGKKFYKHPVFTNYAANKNGDVINVKTERILKMTKDRGGYLRFKICNKKLEKPKDYSQHRFVFEVFKGPIQKCLEIDHINNIKTDNRVKNLQLLTPRQNSEKSNNKAIISICIETGKEKRFISIKKAAIELDISAGNISQVCRKKFKFLTSKKDGKKYIFEYLD